MFTSTPEEETMVKLGEKNKPEQTEKTKIFNVT